MTEAKRGPGRRTEAEIRRVRRQVESLMLAGMTQDAIAQAVSRSESERTGEQVTYAVDSIKRHMRAIREAWLDDARDDLSLYRAQMIAEARKVSREAGAGAVLARAQGDPHAEAQFLNLQLRAQNQITRLLGLTNKAAIELDLYPTAGPKGAGSATGADPAIPPFEADRDFIRDVAVLLRQQGVLPEEASIDDLADSLAAPIPAGGGAEAPA